MKKTLLLIDANSLIHRAFHALPPLSTEKGEMTNAVYGFLSILLRAIKEIEPEYIAAAFDVAGPTKRHERFAEYKATRQKAPDELYSQFPFIKEALSVFHIPIYEKQGFEADDIIGTIAKDVSKKNKEVETIIVTGDLDALQLVNKNTKVYTMRKGIQDSVLFDESGVQKKFEGLTPAQVADYKGLRGDPSDNIPGVAGVGEKTALQLLGEFESIEKLYEALEKGKAVVNPGLKEKLLSQKSQAFLSKELGTIDTAAPIVWKLKDADWTTYDRKEVIRLLKRFEFESLLKRLPGEKENESEAPQEEVSLKIERLYEQEVLSRQIYEVEKKLTPVLRSMEETGIKIDRPHFAKLAQGMTKALESSTKDIHKAGNREFNINSTQQFSEVLFAPPPNGLGLSSMGLKKTPKGVISIGFSELEKIKDAHPIVGKVLAYREIQKLYTTYVKPLGELADEHDRVHTHFDQFGAATGRISSSNPNLQNIPNQGEWGRSIRKGFIAEQGWKLVSFDYSQMELRIAAHITKDENLLSFFEQGADIHQMTASAVFRVTAEEVTPEMRYRAKALNFGVLYGMGAQGFAKSAGISPQEARDFIEHYFIQFPRIQDYIEETKQQARDQGYVETLFARRRYIPEVNSTMPSLRAAGERMAINHPIQGTLADITKMAMVQIAENFHSEADGWNMLLQIHDELLFEMRDDIITQAVPMILKTMEQVGRLQIPVVVDVKQGVSWGEMKKLTS